MSDQFDGAAASAAIPAGWYPDPTLASQERYWDGTAWTATNRPTMTLPVGSPPAVTRGPKQPMWRSQKILLGLTGVALILVVIGLVPIGRSMVSTFTAEAMETPGTITEALEPGRYTVFERTGTSNQVGPVTVSNSGMAALRPSDITVTGPDGDRVDVAERSTYETITRGEAMYSSIAGFDVDRSGTYTTRIDGPPAEVLQARTLFDGLMTAFVIFGIGAIIGGVSLTSCFVIVLVKSSRRRRGVV